MYAIVSTNDHYTQQIKDWHILVYVLVNIILVAIPIILGWTVPVMQTFAITVVNSEIPRENTVLASYNTLTIYLGSYK